MQPNARGNFGGISVKWEGGTKMSGERREGVGAGLNRKKTSQYKVPDGDEKKWK